MRIARATATLLAVSARSVARHGAARSVVSVSDAFDSGNIELISGNTCNTVRLRIKPDPFTQLEKKAHMQWFAFRATLSAAVGDSVGDSPKTVTYVIENAGDCSFSVAWKGAEVVASADRSTWRRIPNTRYDDSASLRCTLRTSTPTPMSGISASSRGVQACLDRA